jgi:ABC-type dipeptide/oligopeptide/nickel transport system permease subunit
MYTSLAQSRYTGTEQERPIFVLGSDSIGRDVLSRIFYGARISLTVGLIGIALSFIFGLLAGRSGWLLWRRGG